jgi:RNA polymerase sigma-70 factor (ECF subfamily)
VRDHRSFDAFYAATAQRLTRHLYLATGDLTRAEECTQEAYLRAWQRWHLMGEGDRDPVAWVRTVAWRLAVNDWRRLTRSLRAFARAGPPPDVPAPSTDVVAVRDALHLLPTAQRAVLVLRYYEDLTVREIADVLGVPEGTVKARLARGRTALGGLLDDDPRLPSPPPPPTLPPPLRLSQETP